MPLRECKSNPTLAPWRGSSLPPEKLRLFKLSPLTDKHRTFLSERSPLELKCEATALGSSPCFCLVLVNKVLGDCHDPDVPQTDCCPCDVPRQHTSSVNLNWEGSVDRLKCWLTYTRSGLLSWFSKAAISPRVQLLSAPCPWHSVLC